jgi:hypothetical protein
MSNWKDGAYYWVRRREGDDWEPAKYYYAAWRTEHRFFFTGNECEDILDHILAAGGEIGEEIVREGK